jgi:hypothetical protein
MLSSSSSNYFSSDRLTWATKSGRISHSATPLKSAISDHQYDFISFLAIAKQLKVDFLPITWQPALDCIGRGATAEIRQSSINLQTSFAFKRFISQLQARILVDETVIFRALVAEILVLSHPSIQRHPNISGLLGICWDVIGETGKVWPVLVFEKATYGDLQIFMTQDRGIRLLHWESRLKLCADVGRAVADMHSNSTQVVIPAWKRSKLIDIKTLFMGTSNLKTC